MQPERHSGMRALFPPKRMSTPRPPESMSMSLSCRGDRSPGHHTSTSTGVPSTRVSGAELSGLVRSFHAAMVRLLPGIAPRETMAS